MPMTTSVFLPQTFSTGSISDRLTSPRSALAVCCIALSFLVAALLTHLSNDAESGFVPHLFSLSEAATTNENTAGEPEAVDANANALSPKMQGALDYAARRYKVSGDALLPIFVTAQQSAEELRLDPLLIVAVIAVESRFNPFSESEMGAQGLMQVIPRFHKEKLPENAGKLPLFDPVINVQVGARALQEYIRRYGSTAAGLQQFAGALDDPEQGYANKVQAEKERMENAARHRL